MKLTKATYSKTDSNGETRFEIDAVVENKKEDIVEMCNVLNITNYI